MASYKNTGLIGAFAVVASIFWFIAIIFMLFLLRRFYIKKSNSNASANISSKRTLRLSIAMFSFQLFGANCWLIRRFLGALRDLDVATSKSMVTVEDFTGMIGSSSTMIVYTLIMYIFIARLYACNSMFNYPMYFYIAVISEVTFILVFVFSFSIIMGDSPVRDLVHGGSLMAAILNGIFLTWLFIRSLNKAVKSVDDNDVNKHMIQLMCKFIVLVVLSLGSSALLSLLMICGGLTGILSLNGITICLQPLDACMNFLCIYLQFGFCKDDYKQWLKKFDELVRYQLTNETKSENMMKQQISMDTIRSTSPGSPTSGSGSSHETSAVTVSHS